VSSTKEIAKALTGHDQPEHVFALKHALALDAIYAEQGRTDAAEIERPFQVIRSVWPDELPPLNRADTPHPQPSLSARGARGQSRRHNGWGAFYQRMRPGLIPKAALMATAHKIARLVYHLRTHRTPFRDLSAEEYEQRAQERELATRRQRAAELGLTPVEAPARSADR
jgi:hypothetical protein